MYVQKTSQFIQKPTKNVVLEQWRSDNRQQLNTWSDKIDNCLLIHGPGAHVQQTRTY